MGSDPQRATGSICGDKNILESMVPGTWAWDPLCRGSQNRGPFISSVTLCPDHSKGRYLAGLQVSLLKGHRTRGSRAATDRDSHSTTMVSIISTV